MKKNIAIVITRLDLGGAQKVALELAAGLDKKKFNVHLICGPGGMLDDEAKGIKNINLVFMQELIHPIHPIIDLIAYIMLIKYFEKNQIDIVHTHSSKAGLLGRLAAVSAKNKPAVFHTVHGFPFHEYQNLAAHFMYVMLERFAGQFTKKFIAVGADVVEYGIKNGVGFADKYAVIRAAVDIGSFKKAKADRKKYLGGLGLNPGIFTVGMIGNLKKQKNPLGFIETARLAIKKDGSLQFIFAGDGPLKENAQELIARYKLEDKVKLLGWIKEPEKFLKCIDLFLLTSLWEGLPCTLVQAAAANVPALASNIGGNREFVNLASSGALFPPGDYAAAAEEVLKATAGKTRTRIKSSVLREFDVKFMVREHEKLYLKP